jgi:hypothetical protein
MVQLQELGSTWCHGIAIAGLLQVVCTGHPRLPAPQQQAVAILSGMVLTSAGAASHNVAGCQGCMPHTQLPLNGGVQGLQLQMV